MCFVFTSESIVKKNAKVKNLMKQNLVVFCFVFCFRSMMKRRKDIPKQNYPTCCHNISFFPPLLQNSRFFLSWITRRCCVHEPQQRSCFIKSNFSSQLIICNFFFCILKFFRVSNFQIEFLEGARLKNEMTTNSFFSIKSNSAS